ncbi:MULTISPECIES: TIR domain-containing protein [Bacillus]|uniref:TIR domain-containing protein n=1 Tax=Bacillus TaxID=1386 RepID=UPI00069A0678|nr:MULTISPECIES: nucleotide-binding protein [Bacillus]MCY8034088.1 nucleotide-binding protein [Bacillus sonorensis]
MNILNLIRDAVRDLEEGKVRLSLVLHKAIRIAILSKDPISLTMLRMETAKLDNTYERKRIQLEFVENLKKLKPNIDEEAITKYWNSMIEDYITRHSYYDIDEDKVAFIPLYEIEERIEGIKNSLESKKNEEDEMLHILLKHLQSVLESIRSQIYQFLVRKEMEYMEESTVELDTKLAKNNKNVFIIHGHDQARLWQLYKLLKEDFKLNPIILSEQPDRGMTLIDKFEFYADQCSYAFALFTPDDVVENSGKQYLQARPNVIFELGWFVSRLGRRNVSLILQKGKSIEIFSDFQGVIQKQFTDKIDELYRDIMLELRDVGMIE